MLWAGSELLSRPSEASLKGCLDSGSVPALFILRRAKRATPQLRSPYPQILLLNLFQIAGHLGSSENLHRRTRNTIELGLAKHLQSLMEDG